MRQYVDSEPTTLQSAGQECYQNYCYRRWVTVDGDEVGGSSGYLDDFPVLVELSGDWLAPAPSGRIEHPSGYDIIFRGLDNTTCDGAAPCDLDHEIEKYTPGPDIRTCYGHLQDTWNARAHFLLRVSVFNLKHCYCGEQPLPTRVWPCTRRSGSDLPMTQPRRSWQSQARTEPPTTLILFRSAVEDANAVLYILNADGDGG